jgi:Spy/CpxP family protein refolding chaperone
MRLRGHFIGALTLAIISIACASANASSSDSAMDEHAHHVLFRPAPGAQTREGFAIADQSLAELSDLSQLHAAR